jgi:quinol monooxygenase YgiN
MQDKAAGAPHARAHSYLFTVQLWYEDLGQGRGEWRGKGEHVASKEACYFRNWSRLMAFFQEVLAQGSLPGHSEGAGPEGRQEERHMYGTIGHLRVKPGMGDQLIEIACQVGALALPGIVAAYCYRLDASEHDYYLAVVATSKKAYLLHAQHPAVQALDRQMLALLDGKPEWFDGEVVSVMGQA